MFSVQRAVSPPALHSFPTRRSSDLRLEIVQWAAVHGAAEAAGHAGAIRRDVLGVELVGPRRELVVLRPHRAEHADRKSTRLNSSHLVISYAVFCLKKKKNYNYINID